MRLIPNCSEVVLRIDTGKLVSIEAERMIEKFFKETKNLYKEWEKSDGKWGKYLLKYMKKKKGGVVYYCSRMEGDDNIIYDFKGAVEEIYDNYELRDAFENKKILKL